MYHRSRDTLGVISPPVGRTKLLNSLDREGLTSKFLVVLCPYIYTNQLGIRNLESSSTVVESIVYNVLSQLRWRYPVATGFNLQPIGAVVLPSPGKS